MTQFGPEAKRVCREHGESFLDVNEQERLAKKLFGDSHLALGDFFKEDESGFDKQESHSVPVWHDEDDVDGEIQFSSSKSAVFLRREQDPGNYAGASYYQNHLHKVFQRHQHTTLKWAKLESKEENAKRRFTESEDELEKIVEEMTRSAQRYVDNGSCLHALFISTFRWPDITIGHHDTKPINVILFHKTKPVVLTAGVSGKIQLFKVDDILDCGNFLQSVQFSSYPITSMSFLEGGNSVVCGSNRQNYFMKYDLDKGAVLQLNLPRNVPSQNTGLFVVSYDGSLLAMVGHSSQVYVLSTLSMELVKTFSAQNNVTSLQFLPASNQELWAMTECGEVIIWDLKNSSQHMFRDEGAVSGTVVRLSSDRSKVACGSTTGVTNVFNIANVRRSADPKPLLTASNLVTSCDSIAFSHDSQIMAFSSKVKKNQV